MLMQQLRLPLKTPLIKFHKNNIKATENKVNSGLVGRFRSSPLRMVNHLSISWAFLFC